MLIDNFEQHFVNCVLNVQNALKSAQNQINCFNTSKNELVKIFCVSRFSNMLYGEKQKPGKQLTLGTFLI